MKNDQQQELLKLANYAGSCAEGPTEPEFSQFLYIEAELRRFSRSLPTPSASLDGGVVRKVAKAIKTHLDGEEFFSYDECAKAAIAAMPKKLDGEVADRFFAQCLKINEDSELDTARKLFLIKEAISALHGALSAMPAPKGVDEKQRICHSCHGTGNELSGYGRPMDCPYCKGKGYIKESPPLSALPPEDKTQELRSIIVAEIMKLVKPELKPMGHKPTIAELEAMLNEENPPQMHINPDGSVSVAPTSTTVGDVADCILRALSASAAPEKKRDAE